MIYFRHLSDLNKRVLVRSSVLMSFSIEHNDNFRMLSFQRTVLIITDLLVVTSLYNKTKIRIQFFIIIFRFYGFIANYDNILRKQQ